MSIDANNCIKVVFINVGGQAAARVPATVSQHPGRDLYCFVETCLDEHSCLGIANVEGYDIHHCTRLRQHMGRPSGGITLLVRKGSSILGTRVRRVRGDPVAGILWLEYAVHKLTLAICYFSPASSGLYLSGALDSAPFHTLLHGLRGANSKGHQCIVLGDFNTRVGTSDADVVSGLEGVAMPPQLQHDAQHFINCYDCIPIPRCSSDLHGSNSEVASHFMHGLNSVQCVLLNGRAAGDEQGQHTFFRKNADGVVIGKSAIDFAIVSASLYNHVQRLTVCDHDNNLSHDHCALLLELIFRPPPPSTESSTRRRVVYRPVGPANVKLYCEALRDNRLAFQNVMHGMQQHTLSVEQGLKQLSDIVVTCAKRMPRRGNHSKASRPGPGAPWFDAECSACNAAFKRAWSAHLTSPHDQHLHDIALEARKAYRKLLLRKKYAFKQQLQIQHLRTYFSEQQGQFWKAFLGKRDSACPMSDVTEWTDWFCNIMGSPVDETDNAGIAAHADVATALHLRHVVPPDHMASLNVPITLDEVIEVLQALPRGKSADVQGLTCELLRLAVVRVPSSSPDTPDTEYVCEPLASCLTHILQNLSACSALPAVMQVSKLTPVPKSGQASARLDKNMYRGISVSSIFSKVVDKLLHRRLDGRLEQLGLRAKTQCGFRKGHGTLDALFTLTHAINMARHNKKRLYVVFVDFKKAFDTVRRDVMIARCQQLGVHGQFLDTLVLLYDKVQQQVCIGGDVGRLFDTYVGTKQGSELSPLLFGMFIDILHELIQMQVPGAGPMLEQLRVPDISYADDVSLIAYDDPLQAHHLLDCLSIFCAIFKMEVNQHESKTCAVVFRCQHATVPADFVLKYRGKVVPLKESHQCLGVVLHATKNMHVAAEALAASGSRAKHAVLGRCRQQCITQFEFKCRIFDILVEPIMSYGCQVWGPDVFVSKVASDKPYTAWSDADKVHIYYLRTMAGVGECCIEVLMRDFNRRPIMHHWVLLAARWFMTLKCMSDDRLAHCAWVADIDLMLGGCRECWTYKLLHTMSLLGVLTRTVWDRRANSAVDRQCIVQLQLVQKIIKSALRDKMASRWAEFTDVDPRGAPSTGVELCTHAAWVLKFEEGTCAVPKHLKLCASFAVLQCLARLRLGWHQLRVRTDRLKKARVRLPRSERLCRLCSTEGAAFYTQRVGVGCVEDVQHFLLECPAYQHLRVKYPCVFGTAVTVSAAQNAQLRLLSIFDCDQQDQLAHVVYTMTAFRNHCLSLPHGNHLVVNNVQQIVEEDVELIRIQ
jgi:hypothetical protein